MAERGTFGTSYSSSQQNGSSGMSVRDGSSSNDFIRLTQMVGNNIQTITRNVKQLQSWLALYGTRQDTAELHDKVHDLQQRTNQLAKDTNKYTKDLNQIPLASNSSEMKQQKMQRDRLIDEFMKVLGTFQQFQRQEKEKEKESVVQARASFSDSTAVSYDPFADSGTSDGYGFSGGLTGQKQQSGLQISENSEYELEMVREREQAIRKLEADIVDVNQIFKDLGAMVHEQGDMIDSIEANVDTAAVSVEQGNEQLRQASKYQSKSRKKKCILLIICLVILAIIAIVLAIIYGR